MSKRLTQENVRSLYTSLRNKNNEKDVENAWRKIFSTYFVDKNPDGEASLNSPCKVDGFIVENRIVFALRILLEFKDGTNLQNVYDRARITIQCIYYMKQFLKKSIQLPNVIVGADENQAFVLYAPNFYKYLKDSDIDWELAPSQAYLENHNLMTKLMNDSNLSVFVYDLNAGKNTISQRVSTIQNLFDEVKSLSNFDSKTGEVFKVDVTESNLAVLFDDFIRITFGSLKESDKLSPVDMVNVFQQLLLGRNPDEYYQLPSDPNKLHLPGDKKININGADMTAFFKHFNRNLSISEQDDLIAISDRLIEDITRRRKGDYWTPTIWANKAIHLIDEHLNHKWQTKQFGLINNWKKDCVVWDCAAGAKNLTRDYRFEHLYSSTIHEGELDLSRQYNNFPSSNVAFQYDFLNDDVEALSIIKSLNLRDKDSAEIKDIYDANKLKMPLKLFKDLVADKPLVFYINPPFGTANSRSFSSNQYKGKKSMARTEIRGLMKEAQMGKATQQLYAQFFFRIIDIIDTFHLTNVILASFSPYQFRVGGDYFGKFYQHFLKTLHPFDGFLFSAGEFSDVNTDWAITFSLYSNERKFEYSEKVQVDGFSDGHIRELGKKIIKTVSKKNSLSTWIKKDQSSATLGNKLTDSTFTSVTSAVKAVKNSNKSTYYENALGYMYFIGNDIEHSDTAVSLFSSYFKSGHGINVTKNNLIKSIIGFSIRRSANFKWYNGKDAFYIDNAISQKVLNDQTFIGDCLVMALSQYRASYQSSLGFYTVPEGYPEVANKWFYVPTNIMADLFSQAKVSDNLKTKFSEEYRRARTSEDTIVVKLLKKMGTEFRFCDLNSDSHIDLTFSTGCSLSQESQQMFSLMIKLVNATWKYRELSILSHPEWSIERYDAGFNQLYKIITQITKDKEWQKEYFDSYKKLRNKINRYSKVTGIIGTDG